MCVPYTGSQAWTRSVGYKVVDEWRPWFFDEQVAGYRHLFINIFLSCAYLSKKIRYQNVFVSEEELCSEFHRNKAIFLSFTQFEVFYQLIAGTYKGMITTSPSLL